MSMKRKKTWKFLQQLETVRLLFCHYFGKRMTRMGLVFYGPIKNSDWPSLLLRPGIIYHVLKKNPQFAPATQKKRRMKTVFYSPKTFQNESVHHGWRKFRILFPKMFQNASLSVHHGWRKFCILFPLNVLKCITVSPPWLKNFVFCSLKLLKWPKINTLSLWK